MKLATKFKTSLQVLCVLCIGIFVSYKLFPHKMSMMNISILSTIRQSKPEKDITETRNKQETRPGLGAFRCRAAGSSACLLEQKKKISELLMNGLVSLDPPSSPETWGHVIPYHGKPFLGLEPLYDPMKAGNGTVSTIDIVGKQYGYRQDDHLTVIVTIRNGYGQPTGHGGDQIRVWMVEMEGEEQKASLATEVDDLKNGSYVAVLPLTWSGRVSVKASLVYNAAVQRAHYYVRYAIRQTRYLGAAFTSYFSNEITLCGPFRTIPGYSEVCDFTDQNGGMPWFCGLPKDETLKCRHWSLNFDFNFIIPLPATEAEKEWWSVIDKNYKMLELIPLGSEITLDVGGRDVSSKPKSELLPCSDTPLRDSWHTHAPRGYFKNKTWIPTTCSLEDLTESKVGECLQNTTILTMGDSNAMKMFTHLIDITKCVRLDGKRRSWHAPALCKNKETGTILRWRSHALPFHPGSRDGSDRNLQKAVHQFIDEIPSEGRFIVLVHIFIHFTAHRDDIFVTHIKAIRNSVEKLLQRNPNAKVAIRGPHTFQQFWFTPKGGDLVAPFYTEYIRGAFRDLEDRVLFLQTWDMTVAMENTDIHPPDYVTKAMVDVMLGHLCR